MESVLPQNQSVYKREKNEMDLNERIKSKLKKNKNNVGLQPQFHSR